MKDSILLYSHLIEKMGNFSSKIVGKSTSRQYKFYLDMIYGTLKSKSIVLNDIAHALNEETTLKNVNERPYKNLMRIPDINERHNLIKGGLTYMREKKKVFIIDGTDVMKPYASILNVLVMLEMLLILVNLINMFVVI